MVSVQRMIQKVAKAGSGRKAESCSRRPRLPRGIKEGVENDITKS